MTVFYKNCKMHVLRVTVSLFARPFNVKQANKAGANYTNAVLRAPARTTRPHYFNWSQGP